MILFAIFIVSETCLGSRQISVMELFAKIVNGYTVSQFFKKALS